MSMNNVGTLYRDGLGVPKDYAAAIRWYRKAVEGRNRSAMRNLGWMYEQGHGVERDYAEAVRWYRQAAALGDRWAQAQLVKLGARP